MKPDPGQDRSRNVSVSPAVSSTPSNPGQPVFRGALKKKVLFPAKLRPLSERKQDAAPGIPMLRTQAKDTKKGVVDWFTALYSGNLAIVACGVAVLTLAPLAGIMLSNLANANRDGFMQNGAGYEEDLLDTLVGKAFGWLLHGRGKPVAGPNDASLFGADGALASARGWPKANDVSAWKDALDSAARGLAKADKSAGLPKPSQALASKLSWLASPAKAGPSSTKAAQLSALSSAGLVRKPDVESNLSRLNDAKDFNKLTLRATSGLDGQSSRTTAGQRGQSSGANGKSAFGGAAGAVNGGNNVVDPQIQKLHEINAKYDALAKADLAGANGVQSALASSQTSGDVALAMAAISPWEAKLAADEAAHLAELQAWSDNASSQLGSTTNALNDALVQSTLGAFKNAKLGLGNAAKGPPGGPRPGGPPKDGGPETPR